jgi:hypothetical protein
VDADGQASESPRKSSPRFEASSFGRNHAPDASLHAYVRSMPPFTRPTPTTVHAVVDEHAIDTGSTTGEPLGAGSLDALDQLPALCTATMSLIDAVPPPPKNPSATQSPCDPHHRAVSVPSSLTAPGSGTDDGVHDPEVSVSIRGLMNPPDEA